MKLVLKAFSLLVLGAALVLTPVAFAAKADQKAPEISLPGLDGKTIKLSGLKGQVVMVNFWASWCQPCRTEMPLIEALYNKYKKIGFTVLAVNVDEDPDNARAMLKEVPVSFPVVLDTKNTSIQEYQVQAMPSTYMVDRKGVIREVHRGYKAGDEAEYENYIRKLLRE